MLYHDPDVLILDKATSTLDNLTEKAVIDAVHNLSRQKTIIMIAHRHRLRYKATYPLEEMELDIKELADAMGFSELQLKTKAPFSVHTF